MLVAVVVEAVLVGPIAVAVGVVGLLGVVVVVVAEVPLQPVVAGLVAHFLL